MAPLEELLELLLAGRAVTGVVTATLAALLGVGAALARGNGTETGAAAGLPTTATATGVVLTELPIADPPAPPQPATKTARAPNTKAPYGLVRRPRPLSFLIPVTSTPELVLCVSRNARD
jgi:hypothetical protein